MKTIKFAAFLFYRYYKSGKRPSSIPHFETIGSMTLLAFFHLMQLLILIDKVDLIPIKRNDGQGQKRLVIFCIMLPIALTLAVLIKKVHLEKMIDDYMDKPEVITRGNRVLITYIILSFAAIFALALLKA
jgi:hypothetical protein